MSDKHKSHSRNANGSRRSKRSQAIQKGTDISIVENRNGDQDDHNNESDDVVEKDDEEDELERLVMGDDANFKLNLATDTMDLDLYSNDIPEEDNLGPDAGMEGVEDADLFFVDSGPSDSMALISSNSTGNEADPDAPAWEDSDDDRLRVSLMSNSQLRKLRVKMSEDVVSGTEYTRRLRKHFEVLHPVPEWAQHSSRPAKRRRRSSDSSNASISSDDMDVDNDDTSALPLARFLQDASSLSRVIVPGEKPILRPEVLNIQRTRDIPGPQPSAVLSLSFHPEYPVLLSSGLASTLYMHHISPTAHPTPNPQVTSVHMRGTPIFTSAFHPKGEKIFFAGRRNYFHTWDMPSGTIQKVNGIYGHKEESKTMEKFRLSPCGRYMGVVGSGKKGGGTVNILNATTTQWIAAARIEGRNGVADFAWWRNGEGLTVVGKGGEVGEYCVTRRDFISRWIDEGCVGATVLTLGGPNGPKILGGDRWVVIGSQSGIVNIYDRRNFVANNEIIVQERPSATKTFEQLVTVIGNVAISPDGQLLAFSSRAKRNALRLVHLPSCTVYRNWPTAQTPFGVISSIAFGSGSDMLAVGNESGSIKLWEIRP